MGTNRRDFLLGTAGATIAAGAVASPTATRSAEIQHAFEMPRGMTLMNMRRDGVYRLGVKTNKCVLDATAAAQALTIGAPTGRDHLLRKRKGSLFRAVGDTGHARGP